MLRAYALLEGRSAVQTADLVRLEHILWNEPSERDDVAQAIRDVVRRFDIASRELRERARQQLEYAKRYWPTDESRMAASVESLAKLRRLLAQADALIEDCQDRDDRVESQVRAVREEIASIVDDLLHSVAGSGQRQ